MSKMEQAMLSIPKASYLPMLIFGYIVFALGAFGIIFYYATQVLYSLAQDMGIVLGNVAITLLGLAVVGIAKCLRNFEERLSRIESCSPQERR
jgi:hypothetical protein